MFKMHFALFKRNLNIPILLHYFFNPLRIDVKLKKKV